jgi:hypothetical protein
MQVAAQPAALFLARGHEGGARGLQFVRQALQIGRQADGVNGDACLTRQVIEQDPVC